MLNTFDSWSFIIQSMMSCVTVFSCVLALCDLCLLHTWSDRGTTLITPEIHFAATELQDKGLEDEMKKVCARGCIEM